MYAGSVHKSAGTAMYSDETITSEIKRSGMKLLKNSGAASSRRCLSSGYDLRETDKNVWIGSNSTILPGVTVGDNAVIGAGSVVTKDIPENMIAVGSPARVIRSIFDR